ncbi:MAG: hypothetical protein O7D91_21035 [Planctomycetota bacterium]|nr:hypothetical protein [Planctomycetota bacterium]
MPNHVKCCTYPVLDWIAEVMPDAPVNIMVQYRPDNFCYPASAKYQERYAAIARRCDGEEVQAAYDHARGRGLNFEPINFDKNCTGLFA